jgi:hypothetical protein
MKICPACRKTYTDDGLNFCLDDGSVLTIAADQLPETVMMNQARFTDPNNIGGQPGVQSSYPNQAAYSMQPKKSSKMWLWVIGILGLLAIVCGGGGIAFFAYVASLDVDRANVRPTPSPTPNWKATPSPSPFESEYAVDLADWVQKDSAFGKTEYKSGEFFMSSKKKGYYFVVAAPADLTTESKTTSIIVRNVDDLNSSLGYGLVFHSNPKPLEKGYAFIIDTKRQKYRVVRHEPGKEISIINWTASTAIKEGAADNKLEIRDTPAAVELYINGDMVTSIKNTYGYRGGVVGLYAGDAVNVGFKNLEMVR